MVNQMGFSCLRIFDLVPGNRIKIIMYNTYCSLLALCRFKEHRGDPLETKLRPLILLLRGSYTLKNDCENVLIAGNAKFRAGRKIKHFLGAIKQCFEERML
ncbi:hypothetical protein QUC31_006405, partial [Theobroma cacao]